jgi:maleate cis-trans isomerase
VSDRAGDCATLLENIGVTEEKILKCSAHIILGADHAADKVFKHTEQKIGVQKLLNVTAGVKVFTSPGSSVHTLALIAISKLLSPSHAPHSVSLYNEYTSWMESQGIDHAGFKGFTSNRCGRIAEIAKEFLCRQQSVIDLFNAVVNINSNKLVLAVSTYIQNDWFLCCAKIYSQLGDAFIFLLMDLLGIDGRGSDTDKNKRYWAQVT